MISTCFQIETRKYFFLFTLAFYFNYFCHSKSCTIWLGGLFTPEAYITATRQFVAQANLWSLEELTLNIEIYEQPSHVKLDDCSFALTGNVLQRYFNRKKNKMNKKIIYLFFSKKKA
jgi:hypothetical protein